MESAGGFSLKLSIHGAMLRLSQGHDKLMLAKILAQKLRGARVPIRGYDMK